jgi:hypothetical protein
MGEMRNACGVLLTKPDDKETTYKTRCLWKNNIKMALKKLSGSARTVFMLLRIGQVAGVVNTIQLLPNTVYATN